MGLHALSQEKIKMRTVFHDWQRTVTKQAAWKELIRIEDQLAGQLVCLIPPIATVALKKKPISWWQAKACSDKVNEFEYYYVVEQLERDECNVVLVDNVNLTVAYYRITLLALSLKLRGAKIMLQTTIAKSTDGISLCAGKMRMVTLGRQIRREI